MPPGAAPNSQEVGWLSIAGGWTGAVEYRGGVELQVAAARLPRAWPANWAGLPICSGLPCAHPTCPNHLELSPGRMGWRWNRQNHPERPLWPREIISPRRQHRAPVGGLPPSPEQRDKAAPLGKGVKPPRRAGYCRELESPGGLSRWPLKPPSLDT